MSSNEIARPVQNSTNLTISIYMKIKKNHYTALIKVSQKSQTTCVYIAHKLIQTCSSQITLREFRIQPKISLYGKYSTSVTHCVK